MTKNNLEKYVILIAAILIIQFVLPGLASAEDPAPIVQAQAILTVSESKRLIAKAVAQMPIVKDALSNGMVIITNGTTNAYVAEEITGKKTEKAAFVKGKIQPAKNGKKLSEAKPVPEIILEKGKAVDLPLRHRAKIT